MSGSGENRYYSLCHFSALSDSLTPLGLDGVDLVANRRNATLAMEIVTVQQVDKVVPRVVPKVVLKVETMPGVALAQPRTCMSPSGASMLPRPKIF